MKTAAPTLRSKPVRRRQLILSAGKAAPVASAVFLAACEGAGSGAPAKTAIPITITYHANQAETAPEGKAWLEMLEQFNKTNTQKITVNLEEGRPATNTAKMKTLAAAGTPGDFMSIPYFTGPELYVPGFTVDIDTVLKKDKRWTKQRADILPLMLERPMWGTKLTSLPANFNIQAMLHSPSLLSRAGVAAPKSGWTWNEFRDAAQKVSRPPDQWGFTFDWNTPTLQIWLGSMGTGLVSTDKRRMQVDTPDTIEAIEFLVGLVRAQITNAEGRGSLFQLGTNATVFEQQGGFTIAVLRQQGISDFNVVHAPMHPTKKVLAGSAGGFNLAVSKGVSTERQDAAGEALMWLTGPEIQATQCFKGRTLPVSKAALSSKEYQSAIASDPQYKVYADLAPTVASRSFPGMPSHDANRAAIDRVFKEILPGKVGVREGLTGLQRETQLILDQDVRTIS